MSRFRALGDNRHVCLGCGGSCQGVRVRLIGPEEAERIPRLAAELGVADPVEDGVLRQIDGRCVFLDPNQRCRLHGTYGADSKPWICRQYPLVVTRTEGAVRMGVDPGCYTAWKTWKTADLVPVEQYAGADHPLDADAAKEEQAWIALSGTEGATVARLLGALCPGVPDSEGGLPAGLTERWMERLRTPGLLPLVDRPENGPSFRDGLLPVLSAAAHLDKPPPWPLIDREQDAWAVETCRRVVFLRVVSHLPPRATALLALLGAVACAWADDRPERYGPALAAWARAIRVPLFWRLIVPSPVELLYLATGRRA